MQHTIDYRDGMSITSTSARSYAIHHWLVLCMTLVAGMVLIGGLTRLTESGLSIVEWKLLSGTVPPLTHEAWKSEFASYQTSPEYQKINNYMELADFKKIFWLEYIHRLLGRVTGLALAIPFILFAAFRKMDPPLTARMCIACILVAAQGAVGWVMVKSGLVNDPRVSPVRLAAHLTLAFLLFNLLLWTKLQLSEIRRPTAPIWQAIAIRLITLLVLIQIIFGAFVAGLDAGFSYNTFPLMDGDWIPQGLLTLEPWSRNLVENTITVQFQHRSMAYIVSCAILAFVSLSWQRTPHFRRTFIYLVLALTLQFFLGILTLVYVVPLPLASAHQLVALLLLSISVSLCYKLPLSKKTV